MTKKLLFILALALTAISAHAEEKVDRPLITVNGQAEILVVPDEVVYSLQAVTMEKELATAQAKNDQIVKALLALARQYQIPPAQVQTGYISVSQRFTDEEATRKPPVFLGYTVSKRVSIILKDVSNAEDLLADIFKSGVSSIDSVNFRTSQLRKYKDQARAMAMRAAQEKAIALTKEIGQSIGKAYTITEDEPSYSYAQNSNNLSSFYVPQSPGEGSTLALGQISITARVTVSFELK